MSYKVNLETLKIQKEYRPTASVILFDNKKRILIVRSAKDKSAWYFPQGGIKENESIPLTIKRELREELSINFNEYNIINPHLNQEMLDINFHGGSRRGYTKGKAFFFVLAKYTGKGNIFCKPDEVSEYKWVSIDECKEYFYNGDLQKFKILSNSVNKIRDCY